jgi:hypothetical protein
MPEMQMLKSLLIGAVRYGVRLVPDLHYEDAEGRKRHLNGHILHTEGQIKIEEELSPDMQLVTLWHEALHGILTVAGHDDQPENVIIPLGYGLVSLLRDNPELVQLTLEHREDK